MERIPAGCALILLSLLAGGCATPVPVVVTPVAAPPAAFGTYGAKLPAADSQGRVIHLVLRADRMAHLTTDFLNGEPAIVETGRWEYDPDRKVVVTLTGQPGRTNSLPRVLTFAPDPEGVAAVDPDRRQWGSDGLVLRRQPAIVGLRWRLVDIHSSKDTVIVPDAPSRYTVTFDIDGTVHVRNDCNRGNGGYLLAGNTLSFSRLATTRMMCPPGSISDHFAQALGAVSSCQVRDGFLYLTAGGDVMKFELDASSGEQE